MAAPAWSKAVPAYGSSNLATDLDLTRDNLQLLLVGIATVGFPLESGWTYFYTGTLGSVTTEGWTHSDGRKFRLGYTYTSSAITKVTASYDRGAGAGYEIICACNKTVDANGQMTAATTTSS